MMQAKVADETRHMARVTAKLAVATAILAFGTLVAQLADLLPALRSANPTGLSSELDTSGYGYRKYRVPQLSVRLSEVRIEVLDQPIALLPEHAILPDLVPRSEYPPVRGNRSGAHGVGDDTPCTLLERLRCSRISP